MEFDKKRVSAYLLQRMQGQYLVDDSVSIRLIVGQGTGKGVAWGCDLSDQYVRINADYTT